MMVIIIPLQAHASVTQQPVNTGNTALDKQIETFYKCVSDTGQDPPSIQVTDGCFFDNVSGNHMSSSTHHHTHIIESFNFGRRIMN